MIEVDGSHGEGGGQILRTSVAMSALTGEPVHVFNIRAGRENPGLRPQHLKAVEAVKLLCGATVTGLEVGSDEVTFSPGEVKAGRLKLEIGTAGSVTLLLQALLPVALKAPGEVVIEVTGGTDVSHSPTMDYFQHVFCHLLGKIDCDVEIETLRRGFLPKGGGRISATVRPWDYASHIELKKRGNLEGIDVYSIASEDLRKREVADRQVRGFLRVVSPTHEVRKVERVYVDAESTGTSFFALARFENTRIGACAIGERDIKAEDVGSNVGRELLAELSSNAPLDRHMSDQIIPYLALLGGHIRVPEVTKHAKTNIDVVNMFGYRVRAEGNVILATR